MEGESLSPPDPAGSAPFHEGHVSVHHTQDNDKNHEEVRGDGDAMDVDAVAVGDVSCSNNLGVVVHGVVATASGAEKPSVSDNRFKPYSKNSAKAKGKGKEKVIDTSPCASDTSYYFSSFIPQRPPPRRPGWGRDPAEDFFHEVPLSHGGPYRKRCVFRSWPRAPKGKPILPTEKEKPRGKLSPDGYPWGATLYDFFNVDRFPAIRNVMSIMTGSALLEAMMELGELDAASEIKWAKSEDEPRIDGAADTEQLVESIERRLQLRLYNVFSMPDRVQTSVAALPIDRGPEDEVKTAPNDEKGGQEGKEYNQDIEKAPEDDRGNKETNDEDRGEVSEYESKAKTGDEIECEDTGLDSACIPPPPIIPITSPFHPIHYPKPWPFIPFENPLSIRLQERISLGLLPQRLYVHDPFNLLSTHERSFHDVSWMSRPDIVRTYNLELSESIREDVERARRKAEELEEFKARTLVILRYKRTKEQIQNHEPMIEVPLPPYVRRNTKIEEGHLYLSPVAKVGQGHHSIVYESEWELPRDLFTRPRICQKCFKESVEKEIQNLKDTGRWEKMLRKAKCGPTYFTGQLPTKSELDEVSDTINLEQDGETIEREVICIVQANTHPMHIFGVIEKSKVWKTFKKMGNEKLTGMQLDFTLDDDEDKIEPDSYVTTIRINPPLSYEGQNPCKHGPRRYPVPRTAKFNVIAKLSIENDNHLAREAKNYQQFPEHFFHHYNGYTIIGQLRTIVPVNAVVPQFYGYYTPETNVGGERGEGQYLSPILLLEHCGEPIVPELLSEEDQDECASLLLRFQNAGWLHQSVAPRNFLFQHGKPTEFPLVREGDSEPSFRLIDFGRSKKFQEAKEKREEEFEVLKMFEILNGKMSVTLGT